LRQAGFLLALTYAPPLLTVEAAATAAAVVDTASVAADTASVDIHPRFTRRLFIRDRSIAPHFTLPHLTLSTRLRTYLTSDENMEKPQERVPTPSFASTGLNQKQISRRMDIISNCVLVEIRLKECSISTDIIN
jgi:hypothetical protein